MNDDRQIRNLALVGFMGTGKSCVGQAVAAQLRFQFLDTDHLIETAAGRSISEIFAREGEAAFREYEKRVVEGLTQLDKTVISTGGGLITNPANLESLKSHAFVVCLWAKPETIFNRVRHHSHRPLLQHADPQGRIRELLEQRDPFYRQADALVNTEMRSVKEVAHQVLHQFRMARESVQAQ